jgi:hypothetical protein
MAVPLRAAALWIGRLRALCKVLLSEAVGYSRLDNRSGKLEFRHCDILFS